MTKIQEQLKEDKSLNITEQHISSERIIERNFEIEQEEYYKNIIVSQLESLINGDYSIFTLYKPPDQSIVAEQNKQVLNILKINPDNEDSKINLYDKTLNGMPTCIQDLMNHPTLTDPAFSKFRNYVKHNQASIFDSKFYYPNWKQQLDLDEDGYKMLLEKFKVDYIFLLQNAIRNDDSAKEKLNKLKALTHQLNNSCKRFIKNTKENKESSQLISVIEAQRNMAARDLYKCCLIQK